ncbi:hypothetical protein [Methylotenera sp. G11]|uniref:hypothetical protein n=1 Tax=Methylotenera sp. G11 TaxID=1506585 RepID=UPI000A492980|nr:hypothetical protein [Methylotenera sp. G11]
MIQQKIKEIRTCLRRMSIRAGRQVVYAVSVALLAMLCKIAHADESADDSSGLQLGGYASAGITAPHKGDTEFNLNEISLLLSWDNNARLKFFSELELERPLSWNENKHFNNKNSYVDLERLYLDYNLSEKINVRGGRFLTPAGRWNLLHAAPLVWTSTRPLATNYLFPPAINGVMMHGATPLKINGEEQSFEYALYAETLKDQDKENNEIIYKNVAGAYFKLNNRFNPGLSLASFTEDRPDAPDYRMIGLDFITHVKGWEISGEGFQRITSNGSNGGSGAYLQNAAPLGNNWYWLTRLETFQKPGVVSGERWVLGLTKRITPKQLLKMEFVGGSDEFTDTPRGFAGSFAVLF